MAGIVIGCLVSLSFLPTVPVQAVPKSMFRVVTSERIPGYSIWHIIEEYIPTGDCFLMTTDASTIQVPREMCADDSE